MMTTETTNSLGERDREILADRVRMLADRDGPSVGDWVIWRERDGERVYRRVSHVWPDDVQTSYGGSFHLARSGVSYSGALEPAIPTADLVDTGEVRAGSGWFFHHDVPGAGRGVDVDVPFRVWAYVGEQRLREALAPWADDEQATPCDATHVLHLFDGAGVEVGNVPLNYGEPVRVGRALRDFERRTGIMARKASDVVTVQGQRATHYGVRVQVLEA